MCMAALERGKAAGIWYVYDNVGEGRSWRNTVCVWQRWAEEKLEEYGMCMVPLERGKPGGILFVYDNVGEAKNCRNTGCVWQRWRGKKL